MGRNLSNYTDLKSELQTLANSLDTTDNSINKYRALILIDQYIAALEQLEYAVKTDVQNYSHTGVTVGRRDLEKYQAVVNSLYAELNAVMYGTLTYADFRSNEDATDDEVTT